MPNDTTIYYHDKQATFSSKYGALFFHCLRRANAITFEQLQFEIQQKQPSYQLHRAQIGRMLDDIHHVISTLQLPCKITYPERKKTAGPWSLAIKKPFQLKQTEKPTNCKLVQSHYFSNSLALNTSEYSQQFYHFLLHYLNALSLSQEGLEYDAMEIIQHCYQFPLKFETQSLLDIFQARSYNQLGQSKKARQILEKIITSPDYQENSRIGNFTRFLLLRVEYDASPANNYHHLLASDYQPTLSLQADPLTELNWHNLQAFILRRKIKSTQTKKKQLELHRCALLHLEQAIFLCIWLENKSRCLDIILNYTFHLQNTLSLKLSTIYDVVMWYQLSITYVDKYNVGNNSVWDRIFFAEFYWDYYDVILKEGLDKLLQDNEYNPTKTVFYTDALARLKQSGNPRQRLLLMFSYFRFSKIGLSAQHQQEIAQQICLYLKANRHLCNELKNDGYTDMIDAIKAEIKK